MNKKKMIVIGVIVFIFLCVVLSLLLPGNEDEIPTRSSEPTRTIVEPTATFIPTLILPTKVLTLKPTEDLNIDNPTLAAIMCEEFVLDRLKTPASAKFPGIFDEWPKIMPFCGADECQDWHVVSYVDAHNIYGAMLRNFYTCQISYVGNDQWKLLDFWFHE